MSNSTKPQPGGSTTMLPKAERRALGKAAAARRAAAKRRKDLLNRGVRILIPVLGVAVVIGLVWWGISSEGSGTPEADASAAPSAEATPYATLPADADPALQTKPVVTAGTGTPPDALGVTVLIEGTGTVTEKSERIQVQYVGVTWIDGAEFDSSWSKGQPYTFAVGMGTVIQGWDQGLVGQKVGSRVQLDIPAALAYGENPTDGRPAGALRFVVDIVGIE